MEHYSRTGCKYVYLQEANEVLLDELGPYAGKRELVEVVRQLKQAGIAYTYPEKNTGVKLGLKKAFLDRIER